MTERKIKTINPATEEVLNEYKIMTKEQINDRGKKARNAFQDWKKDASKRIDFLHDFATQLRKDKEYTLSLHDALPIRKSVV